jgi:Flp pilus assembly protein TadB
LWRFRYTTAIVPLLLILIATLAGIGYARLSWKRKERRERIDEAELREQSDRMVTRLQEEIRKGNSDQSK